MPPQISRSIGSHRSALRVQSERNIRHGKRREGVNLGTGWEDLDWERLSYKASSWKGWWRWGKMGVGWTLYALARYHVFPEMSPHVSLFTNNLRPGLRFHLQGIFRCFTTTDTNHSLASLCTSAFRCFLVFYFLRAWLFLTIWLGRHHLLYHVSQTIWWRTIFLTFLKHWGRIHSPSACDSPPEVNNNQTGPYHPLHWPRPSDHVLGCHDKVKSPSKFLGLMRANYISYLTFLNLAWLGEILGSMF